MSSAPPGLYWLRIPAFVPMSLAFGLQKRSELTEAINEVVRQAVEGGLVRKEVCLCCCFCCICCCKRYLWFRMIESASAGGPALFAGGGGGCYYFWCCCCCCCCCICRSSTGGRRPPHHRCSSWSPILWDWGGGTIKKSTYVTSKKGF